MSETVFKDGRQVPGTLSRSLSLVNVGDWVALVYEDGRSAVYKISISSDESVWFAGMLRLLTIERQPFKVIVEDNRLLALINISLIAKTTPLNET